MKVPTAPLGHSLGTGQSPASSQRQQDVDQPSSGSFAFPELGESPEETLQGHRGCTEEGNEERRRKGSTLCSRRVRSVASGFIED